MKADDLNREIDRRNRNNAACGSVDDFFSKLTPGTPLTFCPVDRLANYGHSWLWPYQYPEVPDNPDAPPGLSPRLTIRGGLADSGKGLFGSALYTGSGHGDRLPVFCGADQLADWKAEGDILKEKYIKPLPSDSMLYTQDYTRYVTLRRRIPLPDVSGLDDPEARRNLRAEHILDGITGELEMEEEVSPGYYDTALASCTAYYDGDWPDTEWTRYVIKVQLAIPYTTIQSLCRVPVTVTAIWQYLPYWHYSESDTSGTGTEQGEDTNLNPEIQVSWTAPLALSLDCRTLWDPYEKAGYKGLTDYETGGEWPRLEWHETQDIIFFQDGISDLGIRWKTLDLEPGETAVLFDPPFTVPERLTMEDLTRFNGPWFKRFFWTCHRPKETE